MPKFIEVGSVVLNVPQISSLRFEDDRVHVYMGGGYNHEFRGDDALALRRYFRAVPEEAKANG
jgi:hypothetical protein